MKAIVKMTMRTIRAFRGRFFALVCIVALSAGFFSGLKITTDAMLHTGELYFEEQGFYDFRLRSTIGFTEEEVEEIRALQTDWTVTGTYGCDALLRREETDQAYTLYAIEETMNRPSLLAGRMPANSKECLADHKRFSEQDLGTTVTLGQVPEGSVQVNGEEFTIVGIVSSPLHIGLDRGTTKLGNGSLNGFLYLPKECFSAECYTDVYIRLDIEEEIYSDAYEQRIASEKEPLAALAEELLQKRYREQLNALGMTEELAAQLGVKAPRCYVLTREENAGYVSFENDTGILSGVANIFPVFFIMIAILVCMTTMSRMVDEERTQIGTLKALGYSNRAISAKYLLYAGSATLLGWVVGFFLCTWGMPKIFWMAYNEIYGFAPIAYLFGGGLALGTLAVSMFFILGSTYASCRKEMLGVPAELIRPRAAKKGKRIWLEHVRPVWSRLRFLQKITIRNMFRYKQRMFMMLIGIGCCAALVVTAFGVRDSMISVGDLQFETLQQYDVEVGLAAGNETLAEETLAGSEGVKEHLMVLQSRVTVRTDEQQASSIRMLCVSDTAALEHFWRLQNAEGVLASPKQNEVFLSPKLAEKLGVSAGDSVSVLDANQDGGTLVVGAVMDNYIYDYVFVSKETYESLFGAWKANTAWVFAKDDADALAKDLTATGVFSSVSQLERMRANISDALQCLNYIILLIVVFSGALAYVVIFNLTNINIAERSREIATVQVLGFYPKETEHYVLNENLLLAIVAGLLGMPLGRLFHKVVMSMVKIDMITFLDEIHPLSYVLAFVCTILFAVIVNRLMKHRIGRIPMAESLKAVE